MADEMTPVCVCVQPIDGATHADHLVEMQQEVLSREAALASARARYQVTPLPCTP